MTRKKGDCMECGKRVANAKLISPPHSSKKLCNNCRKREMKKHNKTFMPIIDKIPQKTKEVLKISKKRNPYLSKDEITFLKTTKYKHDTFVSGNCDCSAIINLKKKLRECDQKIVISKLKVLEDAKSKKNINKKFISGLK